MTRQQEVRRYRRYAATAARLARMGAGRRYRGRYAHQWLTMAKVAEGMA